ncbi:MAG: PaaI family thioesterase [Bacteroidaceae bacterium]|nr:PaaI family thioesterase [Bacteroidaceae bacterium]
MMCFYGHVHVFTQSVETQVFGKEECKMLEEALRGTMVEAMGVEFLPSDDDVALARMPITPTTRQYFGILHGGASLAFAETLAGAGTAHYVGLEKRICGLSVTGNHVGMSATEGWVYGRATALHLGRSTHVWNVDIVGEDGRLISTERVTNMIIDPKKPQPGEK